MCSLRNQVERFYRELWNDHDAAAIGEVLDENVFFRGSLGQEKTGHAGFIEYVDSVHRALGDYRCTIEDLVVEAPKAFARMTFSGIHRSDFMGFRPTGARVTWAGSALFTFREGRIVDIRVLGDLKGLSEQLTTNAARPGNGPPG